MSVGVNWLVLVLAVAIPVVARIAYKMGRDDGYQDAVEDWKEQD